MRTTNITLSLDSNLVREAKILAARRGTSVSRMMSKNLEALIHADWQYESAQARSIQRLERGFDLHWTRPSSRAELHER